MRGILVDTSVWVAAFFEEHEFFTRASTFITSRSAKEPALFCRASEQSWLRLVTTPSLHTLYKTPKVTNLDAVAILAAWHTRPHIRCLDTEPEGTRALWLELAAFAIRAGLPFATLDADFRRFEASGLDLHLLT